jgi:hypothetical protein
MLTHLQNSIISQFDAALLMLREPLEKCPDTSWNDPVAKYPFWMVAYHPLCFADFYFSPSESSFQTRPDLHPRGMDELNDEYPSRSFTREELLNYLAICRQKLRDSLASEAESTLRGPSGFPRYPISRLEFHLNNIRHIQHHAAQLATLLRRKGIDTRWVRQGE